MKNHFLAIASAFLFFSFVLSRPLSAQMLPGNFSVYSHYVDKVMGIQWKKPQGFVDLKQRSINWSPEVRKGKGNIGIAYEAALQSKDGDCLILYPDMDIMLYAVQGKDEGMIRRMLVGEMNAALNLQSKANNRELAAFDFDKYVKTLCGDELRKCFRADTVYMADIPLVEVFRGKYGYCVGIYVIKAGRPPMMLKCFFTEEGKRNKEKYLGKLCRSVKYKKDNWAYDDENAGRERYKLYLERR